MTRKQAQVPASSQTSQIPAQIYLDADLWARFEAVARAQNRSRSAQVRELIRRDIETFESEEMAA